MSFLTASISASMLTRRRAKLIELDRVIAEPALVEHFGRLADLVGRQRIAVFVEAELAPRIVVGGRFLAVTQVFVDRLLGQESA